MVMKRFLSLLALVATPVMGFAADAQMSKNTNAVDKMKDFCSYGPTSAMDETWSDRTYLKVGFDKSSHAFYSVNTIQPLYRDASMDNTVFFQAGIGMDKWHRSTADLGLGYRYLTQGGDNMFGVSLFYFDNTRTHHHHQHSSLMKKSGLGMDLSWFTRFTTLSFGRYHGAHSMKSKHTWKKFVDFNKGTTTLDLSFQLPYLPWTQVTLGKQWHDRGHFHHMKHLDYGLTLNIAGPLAIEMGYQHGWNKSGYVNFVVTFGRPAVREHTLADAFLSDEAFTPRDLKNYTLSPVERALI